MNEVPINQQLVNLCQEHETGKYRGICFSHSGVIESLYNLTSLKKFKRTGEKKVSIFDQFQMVTISLRD